MEIGGLRGLTFDTGQDKLIQDLQYQDQMMQRKRMQDAALAQQLVGDIEFLKGSNEYDANILKSEGSALISRLGEMTAKRGRGWETDPNFLGALNYEKKQLGNSKAAIRSMAYQDAVSNYQKYMNEAAKNPKMYDMEKLAQFKSQIDNYGKDENGNFLPTDQVEPLKFVPPEQFIDKDAYLSDIAKSLTPKGHRKVAGGYEEYVTDDVILEKARQIAESRPRQWEVEYSQNGIDPVQGLAAAIKASAPYKFERDQPDEFTLFKRKQDYLDKLERAKAASKQAVPSIDPYKVSVIDMESFDVVDEPLISGTFGSTPKYYFKAADGSTVSEQGDRFYYTNVYNRTPQKGDPSFKKGAIKEADGYVLRPVDWGVQNGIVSKPWFSKQDYEIKPELQNDYELFYPDPQEPPVLKVKAKSAPINADNQSMTRRYNNLIKGTTGQRNAVGNEESLLSGEDFKVGTDEAGNKWKVYSDGRQELMQ